METTTSVKLCECGCGEPAPIAQKSYVSRGIAKGQAFRFKQNHHRRLPFRWNIADRGYETPCHIWAGRTNAKGYGIGPKQGDNRQPLAHRLSWERQNGPIPDGLCVLHRCDVPSCVNPAHLFLGTQADNVADMYAKGRAHKARGETHPMALLSSAQVEAIRTVTGLTHEQIAALAGCSTATVGKIRRGVSRVSG